VAHNKAQEEVEREARKALREQARGFIGGFVRVLAKSMPHQTFKSGAVGWSLGGKDIEVTHDDGTLVKYRVSILVRREDSIPTDDAS
jgi:hypothetical protein